MIGLLFVIFVVTAGYLFNESNRQTNEGEEITHRNAERGARLFVRNCRGCHGLEGEGGIGPALNNPAFMVLGGDNVFGADETAEGEAINIRTYLRETIACGRTGTFMPKWAMDFGGSLSNTQVDQLVTLIINDPTGKTDFWHLVAEEGEHADEEQFAAALQKQLGRAPTAAEIHDASKAETIVTDASALSITQNTCGQYTIDLKSQRRSRTDPRMAVPAAPSADGSDKKPAATATAADPASIGQQLSVTLGCVGCHTIDGSVLVGPTWLGLFGRTELLDDGSTVVADDEYIRESIVDPNAKVVEGFVAGVMPAFEGLSADQIEALLTYIKTLEE